MTGTASLAGRLRRLEREREEQRRMAELHEAGDHLGPWAADPVGYASNVLGVTTLTEPQKQILRLLLAAPFKVLVPSGHDTGKTFIAAVAVSWWYDSFRPGLVMTFGPRFDSLKDTVWAEVRILRARAGLPDHFIGPAAPCLMDAPDHWAKAVTAAKDASLAGRHRPHMLFLIEEACGVDPVNWQVIHTMFDPGLGHALLAIGNPTKTDSEFYQQDMALDMDAVPQWHRVRLSALDHPNLAAELAGLPKPIPGAVSREMVEKVWLPEWAWPLDGETPVQSDVEWPPGSGKFYRPGPEFQCRVLGQWPREGSGVWGDAAWQRCLQGPPPAYPVEELPEIGCDCGQGKGEDFHAIHCRWGCVSVHHETANDVTPARVADRLKDCAAAMARLVNSRRPPQREPVKATQIPIKVDDDGTGGAITSFLKREGYTAVAIGAGTRAVADTLYPRRRDEIWFKVADQGKAGRVYLGLLAQKDRAAIKRLRQQLLAPTWKPDAAGRRQVEPKEDTREKIGRSPDDADAFNLAYLEGPLWKAPEGVDRDPAPPRESLAAKRGMFGRTR